MPVARPDRRRTVEPDWDPSTAPLAVLRPRSRSTTSWWAPRAAPAGGRGAVAHFTELGPEALAERQEAADREIRGHRGHLHRLRRRRRASTGPGPSTSSPGSCPRESGSVIEAGLVQRLGALNLFIDDVLPRPAGRQRRRRPRRPGHRARPTSGASAWASTRPAGSGPTSAGATWSATTTGPSTSSRTTCGCRRACPTCSRTGWWPSTSSPSCSATTASSPSTPTSAGWPALLASVSPVDRRPDHRRPHPGHPQLGLLRARLPGPAAGGGAGRGRRPGGPRRRLRLRAHHRRPASGST